MSDFYIYFSISSSKSWKSALILISVTNHKSELLKYTSVGFVPPRFFSVYEEPLFLIRRNYVYFKSPRLFFKILRVYWKNWYYSTPLNGIGNPHFDNSKRHLSHSIEKQNQQICDVKKWRSSIYSNEGCKLDFYSIKLFNSFGCLFQFKQFNLEI